MLVRYEKAQMAKTTKTSKTTKANKTQTSSATTLKKAEENTVQVKATSTKAAETQSTVKKEVAATAEAKPKAKVAVKNAPLGHGVGRRKSSVARVWLKRGKGSLVVNGKDFATYFDTESNRLEASKPFAVLPAAKDYDVQVNVIGGGVNSQAGAVRLGLSRALLEANEGFRSELRKHGLLTVDDRLKERKKYGQPGARRKFQFVKR